LNLLKFYLRLIFCLSLQYCSLYGGYQVCLCCELHSRRTNPHVTRLDCTLLVSIIFGGLKRILCDLETYKDFLCWKLYKDSPVWKLCKDFCVGTLQRPFSFICRLLFLDVTLGVLIRVSARSRHSRRCYWCHSSPHGCTGRRLLLQHGPVEGVVVLVVKGAEQNPKQLPEIHVVWCLLKSKATAVVEVHGELGREPLTQHLHRCGHLLLTNLLVFLFFRRRLK